MSFSLQSSRSLVALFALSMHAALLGCSGDTTPSPAPAAGAGSVGGAGLASTGGSADVAPGGSGSGSGSGAAAVGVSGAASSAAGSDSGGTGGGADGGTAGSGGSPAGGSGGMSLLAGAGGVSGGQGGNTAASDEAAAAVLNHYQLLDPCDLSNYKIEASPAAVCPQANAVKNQHVSLQFGGDASVTYNVTLHVRAIMEHYWFAGGMLDPASKTFYTGGVPTVGGYSSACKNKTSELPFKLPADLAPTDNCFNGFNVFALAVSEPRTHYYLNYTTDKNGDRPPHAVYSDDYTVTIPIKGRAMLDFYIIGSDEHECYNHDKVVSGVTLPQTPYVGEFVQFDVTKVMRVP